ncbi:MAG: hypothetical protein JO003_00675 [Candidatus Eremiobacteraeota bacterium]|nr:hypothetical protein [Candidatus Eremiobacteraeota bacterium]
MLILNLFAAVLAVMLPPPTPAATTPSERQLKTIITVISTPYCNSLANHFNAAFVPMLANDRTLDASSVQLDNLDTLFNEPNYEQRFLAVRDKLGRQVTVLMNSLDEIQHEINQLRDGSRLTTDPQAAAQVHQAAQELQTAYDKQRQLSIDLQGMYQAMLSYPIQRVHPALGGFSRAEMALPADAKDVKSYLKFNSQRNTIATSEEKAVDIAYTAAQTNCTPKK